MTTMATAEQLTGPFDDQLSSRLLHQRIVVLGQEVDDPIANRICAQLLLLSAEDQRRDISLYINSPGGSVSAGLGDLRHDAVDPQRRQHPGHGHRGQHGAIPALGGHARASGMRCRMPGS